MIVTENHVVTDERGRVLAGPFNTHAAAWRWIDQNTNAGLEHQDQSNRIGRAFDGLDVERL